ncbi:OmpA family protein [Haliscomenobacter sp.]|uniref:OmpA family protein n=1 Tax=Haliscomenobacter sp. TaxID=2717303 RepID=UPI003364FFDE
MTALLVFLSLILIVVIAIQIGKVTELAAKIRGEEEMQEINNGRQGLYMVVFLVAFLAITAYTGAFYKNYYLGYGPMKAASAHGGKIDDMFNLTLIVCGIVFVITQILLFYFAWRYSGRRNAKAKFIAHDNKLEIIWTAIPAVVMAFLVIRGLDAWNSIMADIQPGDDYMEIEATGFQFGWALRYPGPDGKLGTKNYKLITGVNPLGQDWTDEKNVDDFHADELVLPKGKKIRVRITSKDVLHNFYLPHFRVKMDAIPGIPTYFVFEPQKTNEEFREALRDYPEYQVPSDPKDPNSKPKWEVFDYELACAELCGNSHFAMRKTVKIVEPEAYEMWAAQQKSYYLSNIRFKDEDPNKDKLFGAEIEARKEEFTEALDSALMTSKKTVQFSYVTFATGSEKLTGVSRYELDNLIAAMKEKKGLKVQLAGHTDDVGEDTQNQTLSQRRADAVLKYFVSKGVDVSRLNAKGFGEAQPVAANDSDDNRAKNRRTEFRIVGQ